ncbi:MAG: hypothetical protein M1818_008193 [Claussenomyces sp. TS43310]|nr:MAG: hypothetical protein M1818_008193 [Claussenomyces sp. TS43310]
MEFSYLIALIPAYFFVYLPLSQKYFPDRAGGSRHDTPFTFSDSFVAREDGDAMPLSCAPQPYDAHILSREPLVIYIENFLSESEMEHVMEVSADKFEISSVSTGNEAYVDPAVRRSEVATLDRDAVVRCIEQRARAFQGWRDGLLLERLKIQRYGVQGHYAHHFDWTGAGTVDRVSTFMVYVHADCHGGGTEFPRLPRPSRSDWCRFIECAPAPEGDAGDEPFATSAAPQGVTFKPMRGNAVYWENLRADGSGFPETWHAGLPVLNGTKIGMNIWSWYQF